MATDVALAAVEEGGLGSESVIKRLFNISPVDRPLVDSIGTGEKPKQRKHEFTDKTLSTPSSTEAFYENQDLSGIDDSTHGFRYGNYCQQQGRVIKTTQRARDSELVYQGDEFLQQLMDEGETLRLNEESAAVSRNAATVEVASTSGALMAGAATWAFRLSDRGVNGADAELTGTDGNTGGVPETAPVAGTARGLTLTMVKDMLRAGWDEGAKFNLLMSTGAMIGNLSSFLFDKSARVATMQTDVPQGNRTGADAGNGARAGGVVAQSAVNMLVGDFGTVVLTPNRLMSTYLSTATPVVDVLFIDTRYPMICRLHGYATKRLAQTGLYDQEVLFVDSTFVPGSTYSVGTIADIDPTTAVAA